MGEACCRYITGEYVFSLGKDPEDWSLLRLSMKQMGNFQDNFWKISRNVDRWADLGVLPGGRLMQTHDNEKFRVDSSSSQSSSGKIASCV